jgi:hypothetical protein
MRRAFCFLFCLACSCGGGAPEDGERGSAGSASANEAAPAISRVTEPPFYFARNLSSQRAGPMRRVDGVLQVENACLVLRLRTGERLLIVWPNETEIARGTDGALLVHVPTTDGRTGDTLRIGAPATFEGGPSGTERLRAQLVSAAPAACPRQAWLATMVID